MLNRISKILNSKYITIFLISSPIWAFGLVNLVSYDNSIFSIDFSQLSNINLSLQAKKEGIELYFSILTITGLILAIIQFLSSNEQAKTANKHAQTANDHLQESIKQTEISNQATINALNQTTIAYKQLEQINNLALISNNQLNESIKQTNSTNQTTNSIIKQTQIALKQSDEINKLVLTSNEQLNFSIQQSIKHEKELRKSTINSLLEEIRHNINLVDFLQYDEKEINKMQILIFKILKSENIHVYPNFVEKDNIKN